MKPWLGECFIHPNKAIQHGCSQSPKFVPFLRLLACPCWTHDHLPSQPGQKYGSH